jgi:predicted SAM-dependent methyltransferase
MPRIAKLKTLFDSAGFGLEIGPSYNPVLRKSDGYRVETADFMSAAELREIYTRSDIEDLNYVTGGQSLTSVIDRRRAYDFIIASHVIEHIPDIVQFFSDCAAMLKHDGVLVLAVPDKRHCFDLFQPITTTGEVLQAHQESRVCPPPSRHFDHLANAAKRGVSITWPLGYSEPISSVHSVEEAYALYRKSLKPNAGYIDVHCSYFVPSSFRLILKDLYDIGECILREKDFVESVGPEFFVSLSASGPGCGLDRLTLLKASLAEMHVVP